MKHFPYHASKETPVTDYGSTGTTIRVLADRDEVPHFIMRRFEISPGGSIGIHKHPQEHEIYILEGEVMMVDGDGNEHLVKKDEYVYVPPGEAHGYKNIDSAPVSFICVIPK
ncbi:MAG: cupin domain-containing protein [Promethearchaeota archaeon]